MTSKISDLTGRLLCAAHNIEQFVLTHLGPHRPGDMAFVQMMALVHLCRSERALSAVELQRLTYAGSNITHTLKRLEDGGFIERNRNAVDRRLAKLVPTAKGKELVQKIDPILLFLEEGVGSSFSPEAFGHVIGWVNMIGHDVPHSAAVFASQKLVKA